MRTSRHRGRQLATALAVACLPLSTPADTAKPLARVGLLVLAERGCGNSAFREGLRERGYVEGQHFVIECHHNDGREAGIDNGAASLVRAAPDVIVAIGHAASVAAHRATRDIPIVMSASGDPVTEGLVASFARPGANVTGVTYYSTELYAKRLELLRTMVPDLKRVALLTQPSASRGLTESYLRACRAAARELDLELVLIEADNQDEIDRAFETAASHKAQAMHVLGYLLYAEEAPRIADLAAFHKMPTMFFYSEYATFGGLMGYGPDYSMLHRRAAYYVDRILRGARPGDLPVELPAQLRLGINLTAARDLGLKVPPTLLLRADRVVE